MTDLIESTQGRLTCESSRDANGRPGSDAAVCRKAHNILLREIAFIYDGSFDRLDLEEVEQAADREDVFVEPGAGRAARPDRIPAYLGSLYTIPLLTAKGEAALFRKMNFLKYRANTYRSALDPDRPCRALIDDIEFLLEEAERVRSQLVQSNLRLVVSIARRFASDHASFDELVSEGNLILIKAVETFDYARGFRFSTYVTHAVQRHIYRYFRNSQRRRSTEVPVSQAMLREVATANPESGDGDPAHTKQVRGVLLRMGECLDEREQLIVRERLGLNASGKVRTLKSLSEEVGVCKERVRQLFHKAIDKLRQVTFEANGEADSR